MIGETLGTSRPWNLDFILRRSRHTWQGKAILLRWCMLSKWKSDSFKSEKMPSWFMSPNQKAQRRPSGLFFLQQRVTAGSSMISLRQQVGSGELHLFSLTLTESLMISLWSIFAILNRCLHSSTVISVHLISSESLPTKFLMWYEM